MSMIDIEPTRTMIEAGVSELLDVSCDIRQANWHGLAGNDELESIVINVFKAMIKKSSTTRAE